MQGLRSSESRLLFFAWLTCFRPHIVCIQETHAVSVQEMNLWVEEFNNYSTHLKYSCESSPGSSRSAGVAILFTSAFARQCSKRDADGRLVVVEFSRHNYNFQVMCLYAPNAHSDGRLFFESLYSSIDPDIPLFMCGNFNATVDPRLDNFGCNPDSPWANNWSSTHRDLMQTFNLHDAWRSRYPAVRSCTWHRTNGSQGSRIDMIWLPERLLGLVRSVEIPPFLRSDHQCVYLSILLPTGTQRSPGLWKFNASLLNNVAFCGGVQEFWTAWHVKRSSFSYLSNWYEAGKAQLRTFVREYFRSSPMTNNAVSMNCPPSLRISSNALTLAINALHL